MNIQITNLIVDLKLLQDIEKRALKQFKAAGYDPTCWPTLSLEKLKYYRDSKRLWIAVSNNKPLGFAVVDIYESYAHLEELDVDPDFQRKGVASALIKEIIHWAHAENIKAITLRTFATTDWSVKLYRKFSFEISDEKIDHIAMMIANEKRIGLPVADRLTMILRII